MSPTARSKKTGADRRRHYRFPVVGGMVEPINISFDSATRSSGRTRSQPALLTDLSAGGMSLVLFSEPPKVKLLEMVLQLPGLDRVPVAGKMVRIHEKGHTYAVGIAFTRISKSDQNRITRMAQDHIDCEIRIALRLPEACVPTCTFHNLCAKPQKYPHWPTKKS